VNIPDGVYHVTTHSVEDEAIVWNDRDRKKWTSLLGDVAERRGWRVFAWVLMDTHTHIFLQTPEGDLSEGMHDLNSGYVSVFNMWHDRRGPLFWGRFKGILVEEDYHYWELSRYIHLNPVRAGMVKEPEEYRWGSCRYYFSEKDAPEWLCWEEILGREGKGLRAARQAYREFLAEGIKNPPKSPLREAAAALLGSTGFIERMRALLTREAADEAVPEGKKLRKGLTVRQIERAVCGSFRVQPQIGSGLDIVFLAELRIGASLDKGLVWRRDVPGVEIWPVGVDLGILRDYDLSIRAMAERSRRVSQVSTSSGERIGGSASTRGKVP
jgi:REP element-mobilizing transposase RayT